MTYEKNVIVRETAKHYVLSVEVRSPHSGRRVSEIARFVRSSGIGRCAIGAAGRYVISMVMPDNVVYTGSREGYEDLVALGVIEAKEEAYAP